MRLNSVYVYSTENEKEIPLRGDDDKIIFFWKIQTFTKVLRFVNMNYDTNIFCENIIKNGCDKNYDVIYIYTAHHREIHNQLMYIARYISYR